MKYKDHEVRVIDEQKELDAKLSSLIIFIDKGRPSYIDDKNWYLLQQQYLSMFDYNEILKKRIELFSIKVD